TRDAIRLRAGVVFDEELYEKSKTELQERLRESGFAEAELSGAVAVDPKSGATRIVYRLQPGERFRFGGVSIEGNEPVPTGKISAAVGSEPGAPFKPSALRAAEKRVYKLGAFSGVRVTAAPEGDEAAVTVRVREAPPHTVRLGIGAEFEATRWELPVLRAQYVHRNLFNSLLWLDLQSTLGAAFVPDVSSVVTGAANS